MQMTGGDVQFIRDVDETEYLEYSERQTKSRTGAEIRKFGNSKLFGIFALVDLYQKSHPR